MKSTVAAPPHEKLELDAKQRPTHAIGLGDNELHVGSLVFYQGGRYWVSICPPSWDSTYAIRICNQRINPTQPEPLTAECFFVYAGSVELAPPHKATRPPSVKSMQQAARTRAGVRDVGDEVAEILRPLTLEEMFGTAAMFLGEDVDQLKKKYEHLDNGRKRMVLGNRMRAKHHKGA